MICFEIEGAHEDEADAAPHDAGGQFLALLNPNDTLNKTLYLFDVGGKTTIYLACKP